MDTGLLAIKEINGIPFSQVLGVIKNTAKNEI